MRLLPALLVVWLAASPGRAQVVAPGAAYPPASLAWGVSLRHFFESDLAKAASLPPALEALRPLDLASLEGRRAAAPFAVALAARGVSPGMFAGLAGSRRLTELAAAAESVARGDLPPAGELMRKAAETAEALGAARAAEPPYLRIRHARDGREAARLSREFAAGLRRSGDREYVTALWEVGSAPLSPRAHRVAAKALARELGWHRGRSEKHKLLVLRAMRALGDKTPYEDVERLIVRAALDEGGGAARDAVAREAELTGESVASLSPFRRVRLLAAKHYRETAEWSADDSRRRELERLADRLAAPPTPGYWPSWKPAPAPGFWRRLLVLLGFV